MGSADPLLGCAVGGYRVARRLGEGGMGAVYELAHPTLTRGLALKVLHADLAARPEVVARFVDEARAVDRIRHPGVAAVIDVGHLDDGRPFLTMELLRGETLAAHLARRGILPLAEARAIAGAIADALVAAHAVGVVHRDLKPDNVFLLEDGELKVLDFGIARLADELRTSERTRTGTVIGTPAYMAPEQALGRVHEIDGRSDVYALGVMLYEMVSGALPLRGDGLAAMIAQHASGRPMPIAEVRPDLPTAWRDLIDRMLAERSARPDMAASARAIHRLGALRRRGWLGVLTVVVAAATAIALVQLARRPSPNRNPSPNPSSSPNPSPNPSPIPGPIPDPRPVPRVHRELGTLDVVATPWAEVEIDGRPYGTTPLELELRAGRHVVRLRGATRTEQRTVTVRPGQATPLRVSLE